MDKKLRIVITGATGFVGQHLLEEIDAEKYVITIITRDKSRKIRFLPKNCFVSEADLLNTDSLKTAFKNQDVLINLAAEVRNIAKLEQTNITGTKNLIEAVRFSSIKKIIHLSSIGVTGKSYSNSTLNVDETTYCTPLNEYERTKYISEKLFFESMKDNKLILNILRPTNIYGEYHPFKALLRLMLHIRSGKILIYNKSSAVNYVYVKDLTSLICKLIEDNKEYGIINVGRAEDIETFFSEIATQLNVNYKSYAISPVIIKFVRILGIKKFNAVSNKVIYSDQKLNGFFYYSYGLNKGLKQTIEHYKKQNLLK